MTLEETIKHCEEVADWQEKESERWTDGDEYSQMKKINCKRYADHNRQLAEWLRELKIKRQIITNIREQIKLWKKNDFGNQDYGIGFISALSNIEGLIAYTEIKLMEVEQNED